MASLTAQLILVSAIISAGVLVPVTTAQNSIQNVTLTFSVNDDESCTSSNRSSSTLTFSTDFWDDPEVGFCANLDEIFNATGNYQDVKAYLGFQTPVPSTVNISFNATGRESWDPIANYSNVLYTQLDNEGHHDADDEKQFAPRDVTLFSSRGCFEGNGDEDIVPYFVSNCRASGDCQKLPLSVKSFSIYRPDRNDNGNAGAARNWNNKCVLAEKNGLENHGAGMNVNIGGPGMVLLTLAVVWLQVCIVDFAS